MLTKARPSRARYFHYLVITGGTGNEKYTWLKKRTGKDIWKNLYDFPLIEAEEELELHDLLNREEFRLLFEDFLFNAETGFFSAQHILSHQDLKVRFTRITSEDFEQKTYVRVNISDIHKYPVPRLIENYFKKIGW